MLSETNIIIKIPFKVLSFQCSNIVREMRHGCWTDTLNYQCHNIDNCHEIPPSSARFFKLFLEELLLRKYNITMLLVLPFRYFLSLRTLFVFSWSTYHLLTSYPSIHQI